MSTIIEERVDTVADLLERLGDIPPERVLMDPTPGTATEADLLRLPNDVQRMCELVDGTLVMKAMGAPESVMAFVLGRFLFPYLDRNNIAVVLGPDGHTRYFGNQVRMPDVAIILRSRLPRGEMPRDPICPVAPDLAVEILSPGNTRKEITRKLRTYFESGVRLAWVVIPRKRLVRVYTSPAEFKELSENDTLDGGDVLPGFTLSIREWFEAAR
jgi:Uma2 family endonuclease